MSGQSLLPHFPPPHPTPNTEPVIAGYQNIHLFAIKTWVVLPPSCLTIGIKNYKYLHLFSSLLTFTCKTGSKGGKKKGKPPTLLPPSPGTNLPAPGASCNTFVGILFKTQIPNTQPHSGCLNLLVLVLKMWPAKGLCLRSHRGLPEVLGSDTWTILTKDFKVGGGGLPSLSQNAPLARSLGE